MLDENQVLSKLLDVLNKRQAFSLIRHGDGEAIILNDFANRKRLDKMTKNHFGYCLNDNQVSDIKKQLIDALKNADIIGIPTKEYLVSKNYFWRENVTILKNFVQLSNEQQYCSMNVNKDFLHHAIFKELLSNTDQSITCISSHPISEKFKRYYGIKKLTHIQIPAEARYFPINKKHYPDVFQNVRQQLISNVNKGELYLIGAGILGKIYCNLVKQGGGIAFDIGSVFDLWYGRLTRGKEKKIRQFDYTYKL